MTLPVTTTENLNINIGHFASENALIEALCDELGYLLPIDYYTVDVHANNGEFATFAQAHFIGGGKADWYPTEKIRKLIATVYNIKPFQQLHIEKGMRAGDDGYTIQYDGEKPY